MRHGDQRHKCGPLALAWRRLGSAAYLGNFDRELRAITPFDSQPGSALACQPVRRGTMAKRASPPMRAETNQEQQIAFHITGLLNEVLPVGGPGSCGLRQRPGALGGHLARLGCQRSTHALSNPACGIGGEVPFVSVIEFLHRAEQPQNAVPSQLRQREASIRVCPGHRRHQMQVGPNQLASRLLKSRFRRLQLNAIAQEHLAGQADKFFHRLNGLPFNIDQRLANRVAAPLGFLKDMLAGPEPGGDVLGDRAHLLDDLGLVTERGEEFAAACDRAF